MKRIVILLLFMTILHAQPFKLSTSLDGEWKYYPQKLPQAQDYIYTFDQSEPSMELPSNWYKHGLNHAGVMWFEKKFNSSDLPTSSRHFVEFLGVDYIADIWLNDTYLGSHVGYFQTFEFDISKHLEVGQNTLKVRVNSPLENYPTQHSLNKTILKGVFSHHDSRAGGAWDPIGQDRNSGGIWNNVQINSYQKYKLDNLKLTPQISENEKALKVEFDLAKILRTSSSSLLHVSNSTRASSVTLSAKPYNFEGDTFSKDFKLVSNETSQALEFNLTNAKLWSPHDRSFPHLYELTIKVGNYESTETFGLKTLTQDDNGTFFLNGTPYYIKGTNYISTQYLSEMDNKKFKKDLDLMKDAHINSVRVHAHVEPKAFYDLCDEMGFLVWQDTNLQWGYVDTKEFKAEALKNTKEMVDLLYNHPSIFMWSMHNEPPWDSDWMKWKYPDYDANQNKELDEMLYKEIKVYDPTRLIKMLSSNTEHPWFGWYSGKYQDFSKDSKAKVVSEYGAQAIVNVEVLKKFLPKKYLIPKGKKAKKAWEYHNFQFNWSSKNGVKFEGDLQKFVNDSQTYQADLIKYATEMLRIQKYTTTTGLYQFMFNEGWPSMNWGVVDYYRNTKPGYDALKDALKPIIVVGKQVDNMIEIYAVNDTLDVLDNLTLEIRVNTHDDTVKELDINSSVPSVKTEKIMHNITLGSDVSQKITTIVLDENSTIDLVLIGSQELANNHYRFTYKKSETE